MLSDTKERIWIKGVCEQGDKENVWKQKEEGRGVRRKKTT
jgi:hypothetical protein